MKQNVFNRSGRYHINKKDISLDNLTFPDFNKEEIEKIRKEQEQEQAEYQKKYGDDWFKLWWDDKNPTPDYDRLLKSVNECIYYGTELIIRGIGDSIKRDRKMARDRMLEIYGDQYDELLVHEYGDPRAVELLLNDAIKTGRWKELPDCLQDKYHKRTENI